MQSDMNLVDLNGEVRSIDTIFYVLMTSDGGIINNDFSDKIDASDLALLLKTDKFILLSWTPFDRSNIRDINFFQKVWVNKAKITFMTKIDKNTTIRNDKDIGPLTKIYFGDEINLTVKETTTEILEKLNPSIKVKELIVQSNYLSYAANCQ